MKALLINPSTENMIRTHLPKNVEKRSGITPPLGLLYIASYSNANTDHEVEVLDNNLLTLNPNDLRKEIDRRSPHIVGVTATSFTIIDALEVARAAKQVSPEITVVFGGPHIGVYPEVAATLKDVDVCIVGEGEETFAELLDSLENGRDLSKVKGLVYGKDGEIVQTGIKPFNEQLDVLPFPGRNLVPFNGYYSLLSKNDPITALITSRGCPFKCLYCDRRNNGRKYRARSAGNILKEMEEIKNMNIKEVLLLDDTFTVNRERVVEFAEGMIDRNFGLEWDIRSRVDGIDEDLIKLLARAGCNRIHIGIEAGTGRIQKILRKNVDLDKAKKIVDICRDEGVQTLAYFMIGSPTETREEIEETIRYSIELNPDYAQYAITTPFPGTDLYRMGLEKNLYTYDYWEDFAKRPNPGFMPRYWTEILSQDELINLLRTAHRRFYGRPKYLWKSLLEVGSPKDFVKKVKAGLNILFN